MAELATVMPCLPPLGERKKYYIDWRNPPKEEDRHREIYMYVSLQDTVHWYCDKKFRVRSVKPAPENPDAPYPFYRRFPEDQPEFAFQVNSGPARPEAVLVREDVGVDDLRRAHADVVDALVQRGDGLDVHHHGGPFDDR